MNEDYPLCGLLNPSNNSVNEINHGAFGNPSLLLHLARSNISTKNRLTTLVRIFFAYFSNWIWPTPVVIAPIASIPNLRLYSWEPSVRELLLICI